MKCFNCNINECCTENFNIFYCNTCYHDINIPKLCKKCCKFITKINLNKK